MAKLTSRTYLGNGNIFMVDLFALFPGRPDKFFAIKKMRNSSIRR